MNSIQEEYLHAFFSIAASALEQENEILSQHLSLNEKNGYYLDYHQGIPILFETTMVYLIFRKLLELNFMIDHSCEVRWEDPYPSVAGKRIDLVLKKNDSKKVAYIEFKIWKQEYAQDLKMDIEKMHALPSDSQHLMFLVWWESGDGTSNIKWLLENLPLTLLEHSYFPIKWRTREGTIETRNALIALVEEKS